MLPSLAALRTFETAARLGSFARAADELCVTQSAVSHQVRQLEDWFQIQLFERKGRTIELNSKGLELYNVLNSAFADISSACHRLKSSGAGPNLTIAAIPSVATCWLIPRLNEFYKLHPEISVQLIYAMHGGSIDFASVDVAIRYGGQDWPGSQATPFLSGASVPMCSPAVVDSLPQECTAEHLPAALLLHDTDHSGWKKWFNACNTSVPGQFTGPVFQDFNLLRSAALAGQGIALCPPALLADDLRENRLMPISKVAVNEDTRYWLLEPPRVDRARLTAISAFKAWLLSQ